MNSILLNVNRENLNKCAYDIKLNSSKSTFRQHSIFKCFKLIIPVHTISCIATTRTIFGNTNIHSHTHTAREKERESFIAKSPNPIYPLTCSHFMTVCKHKFLDFMQTLPLALWHTYFKTSHNHI